MTVSAFIPVKGNSSRVPGNEHGMPGRSRAVSLYGKALEEGCSIILTDLAVKYRFIFRKKVYCCGVDQYRAVDIDTVFDYEMAGAVYGLEACHV